MISNTKDLVVLVIDGHSPQFGEMGKLDENVWRRYGLHGTYGITFTDKKYEQFFPELRESSPSSKVKIFYRYNNEKGRDFDKTKRAGPNSLKETFLSLEMGDLEDFSEKYERLFNEPFNYHFKTS